MVGLQKPPDRKKEKRVQHFLKISTDIIKDNNVAASRYNQLAFSCSTAHDDYFPQETFLEVQKFTCSLVIHFETGQ